MIEDILRGHVATIHPNRDEDRASTVGASDVDRCERQVFCTKHVGDPTYGTPRDPDYVDRWGARERGIVFERAFFEPALRTRFGNNLLFAGDEQQTFRQDFLSATPDALVVNLPRNVLA